MLFTLCFTSVSKSLQRRGPCKAVAVTVTGEAVALGPFLLVPPTHRSGPDPSAGRAGASWGPGSGRRTQLLPGGASELSQG